MKSYIRKFAKIKKRKFAKKLVGLGCLGWSLKFGDINPNPDNYLLTPVNSRQEKYSLLETNNQKMETVQDDGQSVTETRSNNCTRVQTGSSVVFAFSKDIHTQTVLQETVMVNNNSSSQ
jgi:hypothetical protein